MGSDFESQLKKINQRLKTARVGVVILQRGSKLSLRAMLPAKPNSKKSGSSQQTIALGIYANPAGLKRAEAEARKIGGLVACKEFRWDEYLSLSSDTMTVGELLDRFKAHYFRKRAKTPKSETTWRTEYQTVFNAMPLDAEVTPELLIGLAESTPPDSRSRDRFCRAVNQLADYAGLKLDVSELAGNYSPRRVTPRDLPTDEEIAVWWSKIPNPRWQFAFGLMACYGLRNHEVFNLDLQSLTKQPGIVSILDGKTGPRRVWPCYPEWWDKWRLWDVELLPQVTGKDNSALGNRVTQAFKRYGFIKPYNLRHAWAVRTLEFGLDTSLAAAQMGHSVRVHEEIYHHWISDRHHQRAFDLLMTRSDRPKAP